MIDGGDFVNKGNYLKRRLVAALEHNEYFGPTALV